MAVAFERLPQRFAQFGLVLADKNVERFGCRHKRHAIARGRELAPSCSYRQLLGGIGKAEDAASIVRLAEGAGATGIRGDNRC